MARLYVFAEGQTEQTFADTLLKPHLARRGVYLPQTRPGLDGPEEELGSRRGGGRHYLPMRKDIRRFLKQEQGAEIFFTTMIDLYSLYADFPKLTGAKKLRHNPYKRIAFLESAFGDDIGDGRFIPHLQLHEYEAYLFADLTGLDLFYEDAQKLANLKAISDDHASPEVTDHGPETAPSKRIITQFPDYEGAKSVVGPQVAELIGLKTIRDKFPHFDRWLSQLEKLGSIATFERRPAPKGP